MEQKIKVSRYFLHKLLDFYSKELNLQFRFMPLTEATITLMERFLENKRLEMLNKEPLNGYWYINIKLVIDREHHRVDVDIENLEQIELV